MGCAKRGEIMRADKALGGLVHGHFVKRFLHPPRAVRLKRSGWPAVDDAVKIVPARRRKPRVEILPDEFDIDDTDGFPCDDEMGVQRFAHLGTGPVFRQINMRDLCGRMHTGVRAASGTKRNRFATEFEDRLFDGSLNGVGVLLPLPAGIRRAVIFNGELVTRHLEPFMLGWKQFCFPDGETIHAEGGEVDVFPSSDAA